MSEWWSQWHSCAFINVKSCKSGAPALNCTYLNGLEYQRTQKPSGVHKLTSTALPSLLLSAHMVTFKGGQNKDTVIAQWHRMCVWTGGLWIIKHMCCSSRRSKHYSLWSKLPHFRAIWKLAHPHQQHTAKITHINCPFNYHKTPTHSHTQLQPLRFWWCLLLTASGKKVLLLERDSQPRRHAEGLY